MKSLGYSLIEMMVSLFLASLIMTALMQSYSACKKEYLRIDQMLDRRMVLMDLANQIRDAIQKQGFTPCLSLNHIEVTDQRYHSKSPETHQGLRLQRMSEQFSRVEKKLSPYELIIEPGHESYRAGDAILIADCMHAEIHSVSKSADHHLHLKEPLAFAFRGSIYLGAWIDEFYYVRKNKAGKPVLIYQLKHSEELTPYVQSIKVKESQRFYQVDLGLDDGSHFEIEASSRQP